MRVPCKSVVAGPIPPLLLFLVISSALASVDPWTGLFREFALSTKESIKKFFAQLGLPLNENGLAGFQKPPPCPLCRQFAASPILAGSWQLSIMSRSFRLNTLSELDLLIDRTQAGLPFNERRTFQELLTDPPEPICPNLTVVEMSPESSKWELAYRLPNGRSKSIIGLWERLPSEGSSSSLWRIGSLNLAQFCVALFSNSSPPSNQSTPSPPGPSFVLLNQVDGWPTCGNFVALTRNIDRAGLDRLAEDLQEHGAVNGLEVGKCDTGN